MEKPVLFIDLLNLYCRCFSSVPLTDDNGLHVGGLYGSLNALQSYIKTFVILIGIFVTLYFFYNFYWPKT